MCKPIRISCQVLTMFEAWVCSYAVNHCQLALKFEVLHEVSELSNFLIKFNYPVRKNSWNRTSLTSPCDSKLTFPGVASSLTLSKQRQLLSSTWLQSRTSWQVCNKFFKFRTRKLFLDAAISIYFIAIKVRNSSLWIVLNQKINSKTLFIC